MVANVISVSRRTDVPAFHAPWFIKRLDEGFAEYRNPFNGKTHRVSLEPEDVRAFVFWTRNPAPLMQKIENIEATQIPFYFLFTINGYAKALERSNPPVNSAVETFHRLAGHIGPGRVRWRYDPIVITQEIGADYHIRNFERIASGLEGATRVCIFSFLDIYGKVRRNMAALPGPLRPLEPSFGERLHLSKALAEISERHGISLRACCEDDLVAGGIEKAHCVDPLLLDIISPSGGKLSIRPTREECGCAASRDIGGYDTCPHGCVYCYANASPEAAIRRYRRSDMALPML
ncbi:MAG: DUF1848 domain-containing protein [Nitrospinaceae bacterium]|nr:DUF1848 domain-containing protein [Nitrospinaceae bacterium]MBT4095958.1 DUF1848 domain-containing protein [Nitrospinaceae bacterium]MBT5947293.1 DUF1848 domain-containing protein [Nitrospinaceae bacterium]MBT6394425.1 DUF1848 domain-containing protein [Nitrospinaceae bacterium]MBT7855787.1 DUF1848 domain-containing protein [Nitrospinaceae bacterium]